MSHKQDEGLVKEKSVIKLKRNYSQEREIREILTFTAGEKEILETDEAKESVNIDAKEIGSVSNAVNPVTILQEKENMIEELKVKLEEFQTAFKDRKEESQIYERILTEELDTMRSMLRELPTSNARLLLQAEYNEERIKIYKSQITALEEKDRNYNLIICRHEQTIMHLKDEVLVAQDKLYKTEKSLENSKRNKEETLDVTVTDEDLGVGNKGSGGCWFQ
jgi:predicted signal transduction protein with EAL and GGDEF domain